jgi:hypothetical protein
MYTQTKSKIIEIVHKNQQVTVKHLVEELGLTQAAVHRALNKLTELGTLGKKGTPPKVYYYLLKTKEPISEVNITKEDRSKLEQQYLYFEPTGQMHQGVAGFLMWMRSTNNKQKPENCIQDYLGILKEAESHRGELGAIEATKRFSNLFEKVHLDSVYYYDFYSLIKFGKTKVGHLLHHGKQAQNKKLIKMVSTLSEPVLKKIIQREKIDAVVWTPHSIPRQVPFMSEYKKNLGLDIPNIEIVKVYHGDVPIAQKSLSKIEERILNAKETMVIVPTKITYKNVLVIDDAVGSGATLNELALQLKTKGVRKVLGFAVVGSYKGFEVIKEV